MKITTWNVNGIRAVLKKDGLNWVQEQKPDVLFLQEVKAKLEQLPAEQRQLDAYQLCWNAAERPGYSGTAAYYKGTPLGVERGLGREEFDIEGRVIRLEYPRFFLYGIYFPNGGEENKRVPYKLDFYAHLLDLCDAHQRAGKGVIITGDFNTAHREIDLTNPKANEGNTGFLPEERAWIDTYLAHGFVDAWRDLYPERVGYTWWSYRMNARPRNVGWRLDYYLMTRDLMPLLEDVVIHDEIMGSDHCPVSLILKDQG